MYADANDYTYPATYPAKVEKILVESHNWPTDVSRIVAEQQAENVKLEEYAAWLEAKVGDLEEQVTAMKTKIAALGCNLARAIRRLDKLESVKSINP